jgi:ceramide glucosyltransferase
VLLTVILLALTLLSVGLLIWQFIAARRFPLHQRASAQDFAPPITLLKPLKGCNEHTVDCLRSWITQDYNGQVQILFGVADANDPVCAIVRQLIHSHPHLDAVLVITSERLGPNAKVGNLIQLARHAKHDVLAASDADVFVDNHFLANTVGLLREPEVGLVNCFYQFAMPKNFAMRWEAMAVNADFWSQVLQSNMLHRQDFALGAVMMARRDMLAKIGGYESLLDYLADDYHLGRRIAATGARIELAGTVVECRDEVMSFGTVWKHQLRWARTIRASQPLSYFFSILNNVTLWALLLILFGMAQTTSISGLPHSGSFDLPFLRGTVFVEGQISIHSNYCAALFVGIAATTLRMFVASSLAVRLTRMKIYHDLFWVVPIKDLLQFGIWLGAFLGNTVEWAGKKFRITRDGRLVKVD